MLFRNFPIQRKLRAIILATSGIVILVTCIAFITYELVTFRGRAVEHLTAIAEIMAENTTASLAFQIEVDARRVLSSLRSEPSITGAAVYDAEGKLFATFPGDRPVSSFPEAPAQRGHQFGRSQVIVYEPIVQAGRRYGMLLIESDLSHVYRRLMLYVGITLLVLATSFLLAYFLSTVLQRSISEPIISLANTAKAISEKNDYTVRAVKESDDELGLLTDAFNQMLAEIHENQLQLRNALDETKKSEEKVREMNLTLEKRVRERTSELQEAVAQMEAFSYSVSHDLRGPLRAMQGYASALLQDYGSRLDDEAKRQLNRISASAIRMDALVQDILTYSRVARGDLKIGTVNLEKLVHELIQQNPSFQEPKATVTLVLPLLSVLGHEAALNQCFSNLLSNAVKFVSPGVKPKIRIWTEQIGMDVRIWIQDNGIGIKPEHFDRIFRIFERVHAAKAYEGTGIGLAIVKKAIERMNGKLGLESEPGVGTKFWMILPHG